MNQRTKNRDNVLRSEFYHYSQRNYCIFSTYAICHVAVNENVVCASDLDLAACLTGNSRLLHRGDMQ